MVIKLDLPAATVQRMVALAPLAKRACIARRLVEVALEVLEQEPGRLVRPVKETA